MDFFVYLIYSVFQEQQKGKKNGHVVEVDGIDMTNGVVLCKIVNELEENKILEIRKSCITSLHKKENVRRYLKALREMGMPREELIEEDEIVFLHDKKRVLDHIFNLFKFVKRKYYYIDIPVIEEHIDSISKNSTRVINTMQTKLKETARDLRFKTLPTNTP